MGCSHNCDSCSSNCGGPQSLQVAANAKATVKKVIGVVSGKGGVGKSLLTSSLAVGMTRRGYTCGILDADITGPSIPKTFGVHEKLDGTEDGILPARSAGGVQMISINLVLPNEDDPVIYRGPIIAETVKQFWSDVLWDEVDFLFVDMPPGTGDVPLTVFQSLPVDGILVVTSPQDLVSMIVGKAVKMAKMMNIPLIGIVENYSYLACPDCGKHISVFGESKIDEVAAQYELPVLARLPLDPSLAAAVDAGKLEDAKLPEELTGAMRALEGML
ncbi:Mrp/NBP35 family ATP-binding protein [Agathobaculum sp. NTUH-O15-33]|uniref:Mrp/NBP35 family ATP-binding protein n=1 Tax=Agathobaculum sp. NTUH-O15-33 TaxID=3079302 RepID=UPI002958CD0D|nr:Mrp/NBP35 family ATP-binding protein [Agathobaculum sp. NTUH-O15-33]WNX84159.1 Mrp/NBP35 family ATP-binding protein [Agathobaculum sp. NTUH-O15-33]